MPTPLIRGKSSFIFFQSHKPAANWNLWINERCLFFVLIFSKYFKNKNILLKKKKFYIRRHVAFINFEATPWINKFNPYVSIYLSYANKIVKSCKITQTRCFLRRIRVFLFIGNYRKTWCFDEFFLQKFIPFIENFKEHAAVFLTKDPILHFFNEKKLTNWSLI